MRFGITRSTGLAATLGALADLATVLVEVHVFRLYPFSATFLGTVYLILGSVFFQLPIPLLLEVRAEQCVDVLQIDFSLVAAFGWHVSGVFD